VGGEQVALHPVGKELQCALSFDARFDALVLACQTLRQPLRQGGPFDRLDRDRHA